MARNPRTRIMWKQVAMVFGGIAGIILFVPIITGIILGNDPSNLGLASHPVWFGAFFLIFVVAWFVWALNRDRTH